MQPPNEAPIDLDLSMVLLATTATVSPRGYSDCGEKASWNDFRSQRI